MSSNNIISISKFLFIYYNIEGDCLHKLTHQQIKEILGIKTLPNDAIKESSIASGRVILVKDTNDLVLGYRNPLLNTKEILDEEPINVKIDFEDNPIINTNDISDYSSYELTELIKTCKKTNNDKAKNIIIKELNKRDGTEKYSKEKIIEKVRKRETRKDW